MQKNIIGLKKLKINIIKKRKENGRRKKKKENSTELQQPNIRGRGL